MKESRSRYGPYKTLAGHMFYIDVQRNKFGLICKRTSVLVHREVLEQYLERKLESWEVVHHKDHNKENNDVSNLEITTQPEHARHHRSEQVSPGPEMVDASCMLCQKPIRLQARIVRHNQQMLGKAGPFCGRSCASKWSYKNRTNVAPELEHGTASMYEYHRCRCTLCKSGNAIRKRAQKIKRKTKLSVAILES